MLTKWIQSTIYAQEARKLKVYPTDKELNDRIDTMRKQAEYSGSTLENILKQQAITMDAFRAEQLRTLIRENVIAERSARRTPR